MVVQHNLQAMNSNRMLGITQGTLSSSTEKLSSGYKINRAADDAAGLSISEKMRKQIRGLNQASANAEDGISSVQTAEGALQEVTDMLQRMNELVVQAANGTNSLTDRQYIQDEIDQLVTEVDRVAETTKFNETYLLKGDSSQATTKVYTANYAVTYTINAGSNGGATGVKNKVDYTGNENIYIVSSTIGVATSNLPLTANTIAKGDDITKYLSKGSIADKNGTITDAEISKDYMAFKNADISGKLGDLQFDADTGVISTDPTGTTDLYILNTETNEIKHIGAGEDLSEYLQNTETTAGTGGNLGTVDFAEMKDQYRLLAFVDGDESAAPADSLGGTDTLNDKPLNDNLKADESLQQLYDADGNAVSGIALSKYFDDNGNYTGGLYSDSQATSAVDGKKINNYITKNTAEVTADLSFSLQVGADSSRTNKITTNIQSMSAAALGVNKLSSNSVGIVDETGDNATDAIDVISAALQKVSTQRSALGAVQNRLEHTIKNLDNIVENTTSAESAIRDTDMADEMVTYSNANILAQAGQSMLAQANQSNQGVLSILG